MSSAFDLAVPGHSGGISRRRPDGSLSTTAASGSAYRAACSCGWTGAAEHPPTELGEWSVASEWGAHVAPILAAAPPDWLLNRAESLRENLRELAGSWPLQALGVLAAIERWQRPLLQQAVDAARAGGTSWAQIGAALGVTKQSAHERFSATARRPPAPAEIVDP